MPRFPLVILLSFLLPTAALSAEKKFGQFIDEAEPEVPASIQEGKQWEEGQVALPPWPTEADLVQIDLDSRSAANFRYFIDSRHLKVGGDGVVRYTLVAESPSGARNITFEGLRCTPKGTYRLYAYGSNNTFTPVEGGDWQSISLQTGDRLHKELHGHFLCISRAFTPRPIKDMVRAFKGQIQGRENDGFLSD